MSKIKKIINEFFRSKYSNKERIEFYKWLNSPYDIADKEHELSDFWSKIEIEANLDIEKSYEKTCAKIDRTEREQTAYSIRRNAMKWVAVIMFPLFVTLSGTYIYVNYSDRHVVEWVEVCTKYGERRTVILPDSSVIALNSGSKLIYPKKFRGKLRQVFLSGEGHATIIKNKNKPFVLSAGDINVEVLGTAFNVKSYLEDSEVEIALTEGSVLVTISTINESLQLKPGEIVRYDKTNSTVTKRYFKKSDIVSGNLNFINARFRDIVSQLERSFNVQIVVTDKSILDERYYAMFVNNENVDQILKSLNLSKSLKIDRNNDIIFINKR